MLALKRLRAVFVGLLFVGCLAIPAGAWEFEMTGAMNWTFEFYNQRGAQGFFGPYNVDNGAGTTTSNLNYWWNGARVALNTVTGQDASRSYFYVVLEPTVKINPAVRLKGRYRLGQWNFPQAGYYYTLDAPGTDNAFSEGQWTMFWGTAVLPWGTFGIGKRPWKFGTGLQYDGADGLTTETVLLNAPFGPLDIGIGFYPHRPARAGQTPIFVPGGSTTIIDPYNLVAQPYFNHADKSGVMLKDLVAYAVYSSGPMQAGILGAYGTYHIGPEAPLFLGAAAAPLGQDSDYYHGTVFTKYNNGRFFFNAEGAWLYWTDRLLGAGALSLLPSPRYTEQWRYMIEAGAMAGPGKLTFLYAFTPGPDRRASNLIGKQSAAFVWHPNFDVFLGNYDVFRPYSFLLSYNYGGGFNGYNLSNDGYMRDAWILASRLDYAVAANLNVYGTFLWAERTAHGYGWACISPHDANNPVGLGTPNDGNIQFVINGATGSPNIPDRALGWEIDVGMDWQLLEGLTTGVLVGYWNPGKWFSYACIDRSVTGWNTPAPGNNWGTRPDRNIDPIIGGQVTISYSF